MAVRAIFKSVFASCLVAIALFALCLFASCGGVGVGLGGGSTSAFNDPTPSGTPLYQGTFSGQNGQTVSGNALIFLSNGVYTLTLQGLSTPSESGLQIRMTSNPANNPIALRGTSGNQNYTLSITPPAFFSNVNIFSTQTNTNYGAAILLKSS